MQFNVKLNFRTGEEREVGFPSIHQIQAVPLFFLLYCLLFTKLFTEYHWSVIIYSWTGWNSCERKSRECESQSHCTESARVHRGQMVNGCITKLRWQWAASIQSCNGGGVGEKWDFAAKFWFCDQLINWDFKYCWSRTLHRNMGENAFC